MNDMTLGISNLEKEDLEDVKRVIHSDKFAQFLLSNTTSFIAAAWILQTLIDAEENTELVEEYGVRQAPTLIVVNVDGVRKVANASNIKAYAEEVLK